MRKISRYLIFVVLLAMLGCASRGKDSHAQSPQIDRISEAELARIMPKPVAMLSLDDLLRLTKEGASADQIIAKIKMSDSFYDLTPSQSIELHKQGVDNKVLDYIYTSRELALNNNVAAEINRLEQINRVESEKLKRLQQQYLYDPCRFYGFYPYGYGGYGGYGSHHGSSFGLGLGFSRPWGCW